MNAPAVQVLALTVIALSTPTTAALSQAASPAPVPNHPSLVEETTWSRTGCDAHK